MSLPFKLVSADFRIVEPATPWPDQIMIGRQNAIDFNGLPL